MNKNVFLLSLLLLSTTSYLRALPDIEFSADAHKPAGTFYRASFNEGARSRGEQEVKDCLEGEKLRQALATSPMFQAVRERGLLRNRFVAAISPLEARRESLLAQMEVIKASHSSRRTHARKLAHINALLTELDRDLNPLRKKEKKAHNQPHTFISDPDEQNLLIAALLGHSYAPRKLVERFGSAYRPLLEFVVEVKSKTGGADFQRDFLVCNPKSTLPK